MNIRHGIPQTSNLLVVALAAVGLTALAVLSMLDAVSAVQTVAIDADDIGGVVRGPGGPEAGVWVIAETDDLDTRLRKIVVTDDEGRYVLPDLPDAEYDVWVRGYGLSDSSPQRARPGELLDLPVVAAGTPVEAAQVYPRQLLVFADQGPGERGVPRNRCGRQRHFSWDAYAGPLDRRHEAGLSTVSSTGKPGDPRAAQTQRFRLHGRGLGAPIGHRPARLEDGRYAQSLRS